MGLFSMLSPVRIKREPDKCIDCAKCAKVCPSNLPVDVLVQIKSAECLGCLECVAICPAEGALDLALFGKRPVGTPRTQPWIIVALICTIFFGIVGYAKYTGHWHSPIPDQLYQRLIPQAQEFNHP
jgi:ferredoxin